MISQIKFQFGHFCKYRLVSTRVRFVLITSLVNNFSSSVWFISIWNEWAIFFCALHQTCMDMVEIEIRSKEEQTGNFFLCYSFSHTSPPPKPSCRCISSKLSSSLKISHPKKYIMLKPEVRKWESSFYEFQL